MNGDAVFVGALGVGVLVLAYMYWPRRPKMPARWDGTDQAHRDIFWRNPDPTFAERLDEIRRAANVVARSIQAEMRPLSLRERATFRIHETLIAIRALFR